MYTLGREDQLSWDSEESFPPKKLITTHFSTDSCSFPLKEIPSNTIHNIDKPNYSQKIDSFYFKTSTIFQDQTRASSPITNRVSPSPLVPHKSSSFDSFDEDCISNYNRKIETLKSQLDQLYLVRDRHSGIKAYINSIKEQLQNSFNLGIVELQRQRKAYVDKIDEQYDLAFNQMCLGHKEKELKIKIRDQELECVICQIKNTISMIELKLRAEPKQRLLDNFEKIYKESEATLKI